METLLSDSLRLSNAPALVDVTMPVDDRYLEGRGVGAGFHRVDASIDGHLRLVSSARERLGEDAAVEAVTLRDPEQGENRRRHVHVAGRRVDHGARLEIDAPRQERVAHVPRAQAAVVA